MDRKPLQINGLEFREALAFLTGFRREAVYTGMDARLATEGPGGVLYGTSRSPRERNAVDMPRYAAAVENR